MQRSAFFFFHAFQTLILTGLLIVTGCANQVSPQGGPKDTDPPAVLSCDPPNHSPGIRNQTYRLFFDEFVNLKNAASEIVVSPPQKAAPDIRLRGKSLVMTLQDSLLSSTTYTITFGNSLSDFTEGNVLKNFRYVFSTGTYIDSLSLDGRLQGAFDHKPVKDIIVGLYPSGTTDTIPFDSLPLRVAPRYIARTDERGNFGFGNLKEGKYRMFAIADGNGNLVFDQPSEKIAFSDSLVTPFFREPVVADSLRADTTRGIADSLPVTAKARSYPEYLLNLFEEVDSVQRVRTTRYVTAGEALVAFRFPVRNLRLLPVEAAGKQAPFLTERSTRSDTVRIWTTDPTADSLRLVAADGEVVIDTLELEMRKEQDRDRSATRKKPARMGIISTVPPQGLNPFTGKAGLVFSCPVEKGDPGGILLVSGPDTLRPAVAWSDSLHRRLDLKVRWEEEKKYTVILPDSVFYGWNGLTHDSLFFNFTVRPERDFGNLILSLKPESYTGPWIVRLLSEKEDVLFAERTVTGAEVIRFEWLSPGKYIVKTIADRNKNGQWDTGNYRKLIQPEEVMYFPRVLEVRANWDLEETWNF